MFFNEDITINQLEDDPSVVFQLIRDGYIDFVDKVLSRKIVDINTTDDNGNNILMRLLKEGYYDLVNKYIVLKELDINHQNNDGDTFSHILVTIDYVNIVDILKKIRKNKNFIPNIKNNLGETILDKSINKSHMYTTIKILEDKRFNNIDVLSFKNLYDTYVKSREYGKYTKLTNLELIIDNLDKKSLSEMMRELIQKIKDNFEAIKNSIINNNTKSIDGIISECLNESTL